MDKLSSSARGYDSNVAVGVNSGVASPSSWSKPIYNAVSETNMTRIRGLLTKATPSFSKGTP